MFNLLPKSEINRIGKVVIWGEKEMVEGSGQVPPPNQNRLSPFRGYLLQNVYSNNSGLILPVSRVDNSNAAIVRIVGTNYVVNSQFTIQLWATANATAAQPNPVSKQLLETAPINANSDAPTVQQALLLAAQLAGLTVSQNDFSVYIGNPYSSNHFTYLVPGTLQPEIVLPSTVATPTTNTTQVPQSFVGAWVINVAGSGILGNYSSIIWKIGQTGIVNMKGASTVVIQPTNDIPGEVYQTAFDVMNRPSDYPWVAGSLVVCLPFPDLGWGIITSDFRNQLISLPAVGP